MRALEARAPTRIDFGGGWTDVPPYSEEQGGCVCNLAIARYVRVRLSEAEDAPSITVTRPGDEALVAAALARAGNPPVHVSLTSDFPAGAGLGGSSAAGVAMSGALNQWCGISMPASALAEASRLIEVEDLGIAGGRQDHYAAACGGALGLWFGRDTTVRRLSLPPSLRDALEQQCIVAYTGQSRISAATITAVLDAYRDRTPRVVDALASLKSLAASMIEAIERGSVDDLGRLVGEHWIHQRALHAAIPTPQIDAMLERARAAGALGGKALGASGGGCVLVIAPTDRAAAVREAVGELGDVLPFTIDDQGFQGAEHRA